jgi:hypothetical protein
MQEMHTDNIGKIVVIISCVFLAIQVTICIVLGAASGISMFTAGPLHALFALSSGLVLGVLIVLLVLHFLCAIRSAQKKAHVAMLILMPIIVITAFSLCRRWEHYGYRRLFLEKGLPEYQGVVDKILRNPSMLKDQRRLQILAGHPAGCSYVHGEMKSDGSVVIFFSGADHWRQGFVYYSGSQIDFDTNRCLTNGWYEGGAHYKGVIH